MTVNDSCLLAFQKISFEQYLHINTYPCLCIRILLAYHTKKYKQNVASKHKNYMGFQVNDDANINKGLSHYDIMAIMKN